MRQAMKIDEELNKSKQINNVSQDRIRSFLLCNLLQVRLGIILLQFFFNWWDFSTDAFKGVPNPNKQGVLKIDGVINNFLSGFNRWDAVHFLHIAEYGYIWEQNLAFFPLFPLMVRYLSYLWASPFLYFNVFRLSTILLTTATIINQIFFVFAGQTLYRIVLIITDSTKQAMIAVMIFSVNPASIFFSAAYSESLYSLLTFGGILNLVSAHQRTSRVHGRFLLLTSGIFALAFATRSNGILNFGYIGWFCIKDFFENYKNTTYHGFYRTFGRCYQICGFLIKLIICLAVIISLVFWHGTFQSKRFCGSHPFIMPTHLLEFARNQSLFIAGQQSFEWCSKPLYQILFIPAWYGPIQQKYWDVGFLCYWRLSKIPCFCLSAPAIFLCGFGVRNTFSKIRYNSLFEVIDQANLLFPLSLHALFMAAFAIFVYNVEVFTRMFYSSSPFPYLIIAKWISDLTPQIRLSDLMHPPLLPFLPNFSRRGGFERIFCIYLLLNVIIGTLCFVIWLPFT